MTTEELAREWLKEAESIGWYSPCVLENLTALLDRVKAKNSLRLAESGANQTLACLLNCMAEARAEEQNRCIAIIQAKRAIAANQKTSGCADTLLTIDEILSSIKARD